MNDYSDLGGTVVSSPAQPNNPNDYSDLGGVPVSQPTQSNSILGELKSGPWFSGVAPEAQQMVSGIDTGATEAGANILGDIGSLTGNKPFANQMNQLVQNAPQMYGTTSPTTGESVMSGVGQVAPYLLGGAEVGTAKWLSELPIVGKILSPMAQQGIASSALFGGTQSAPGHAIGGALSDAALATATAAVPSAVGMVGGLGAKLQGFLTGKPIQDAGDSLFQNISGNLPTEDLKGLNFSKIYNMQNNIKQNFGNQYSALGDNALARGYDGTQKPITLSEGSVEQPGTAAQLVNLGSSNLTGTPITSVGSTVQKAISKFSETPSFDNAHLLQSLMGRRAGEIRLGTPNMAESDTANALDDARTSLQGDIASTFANNGDQDLANSYSNLTNLYGQNAIPYRNVGAIKSALQGKTPVPDVSDILQTNDLGGNRLAIRKHLLGNISVGPGFSPLSPEAQSLQNTITANPVDTRSLVAQALGDGSGATMGESGYATNVPKLISNYRNMGTSMKSLVPQDISGQLNQLAKQNASRQKIMPLIKAAKFAAPIGAATAVGIPIVDAIRGLF